VSRPRFARHVGPYAQDWDGAWWLLHPSRGWVALPFTFPGRGVLSYLREILRSRAGGAS
jgi:hypothetical protein